MTAMTSLKQLKGVAHDIAHHAQSGLSFVHPHLGQACRAAGVTSAWLDLLEERPYPEGLPVLRPLELALGALRDKFVQMAGSKGIPPSEVEAVRLEFTFPPSDDNYSCSVGASITDRGGKSYQRQVTSDAVQHALQPTPHGVPLSS